MHLRPEPRPHRQPAPGRAAVTSIVGPDRLRLAAAVLLLSPGVPLLFMGEEYGETAPFAYFVDHGDPELRRGGAAGAGPRRSPPYAWERPAADPADRPPSTPPRIDPSQATAPGHAEVLALHRALLALRREQPVRLARSASE